LSGLNWITVGKGGSARTRHLERLKRDPIGCQRCKGFSLFRGYAGREAQSGGGGRGVQTERGFRRTRVTRWMNERMNGCGGGQEVSVAVIADRIVPSGV
jgi:hypothetical protein